MTADPPEDTIDDVPTVSCTRCDTRWTLAYELDELQVGNQAVEQFALDHKRHTGHLPDDVSPVVVSCERCPDGEEFLSIRPATRWAQTHARHTGHVVRLQDADGDETRVTADRE